MVLLLGTALRMKEPFKAVVEDEKALRLDLVAVNSYLPEVALTLPFAPRVGSPDVALVSLPPVFTPVPERVTEPSPKPISAAVILFAVVPLPVSADLENGFADDAEGVAETVRLAAGTGLAGCSVEDWSGDAIYPRE